MDRCRKREGAAATSWWARFSYVDPRTGGRRWKRVAGKTKRECGDKVLAAHAEAVRGNLPAAGPAGLTLGQWLAAWAGEPRPRANPRSRRNQDAILARHAAPHLGAVPLRRLSETHVAAWHRTLRAVGLAPATVRRAHTTLASALDGAVGRGLLAANPCRAVGPPALAAHARRTWTAAEAARFLAAVKDDPLAALWTLAVGTGLRRGELVGLRWEDVDLGRATLAVRRSIGWGLAGEGLIETPPKTAAGRRPVALPPSCVAALAALPHRDGWVFPAAAGGPLDPNLVGVRWKRLVAALGLPPIRLHDLRHTHATLLLAAGVHPRVVQERLGHADVGTTLRVYSHVGEGLQAAAAAAFDAGIGATPVPLVSLTDERKGETRA